MPTSDQVASTKQSWQSPSHVRGKKLSPPLMRSGRALHAHLSRLIVEETVTGIESPKGELFTNRLSGGSDDSTEELAQPLRDDMFVSPEPENNNETAPTTAELS